MLHHLTASIGMSFSPYVTCAVKINIHTLLHLCLHNTSSCHSWHFIYFHHNSATLNCGTMNLTIRFTFTVINMWYFICLTSGDHSYNCVIGIGFDIGIICLTSCKHSISNIVFISLCCLHKSKLFLVGCLFGLV